MFVKYSNCGFVIQKCYRKRSFKSTQRFKYNTRETIFFHSFIWNFWNFHRYFGISFTRVLRRTRSKYPSTFCSFSSVFTLKNSSLFEFITTDVASIFIRTCKDYGHITSKNYALQSLKGLRWSTLLHNLHRVLFR